MKLKIAKALIFSVSIGIALTGCSLPGVENISFNDIGNIIQNNSQESESLATQQNQTNTQNNTESESQVDNTENNTDTQIDSENYYLRNKLDDDDKEIYDKIYKAISSFKTKATIKGSVDTDKLQRIIIAVTEDHPEYFWISGGCSITDKVVGFSRESEIEFDMPSGLDIEKSHFMFNELMETVKNIVASVPQGTDYDKALYLHDYLVQNCTYAADYESVDDTTSRFYHSVYGCLMQGTAVCEGYADSYHLLLREAGIESGIVTGTADGGDGAEGHAWNYLKLDGSWYWADVTWDDPKSDNEGTWISHSYFLITDDILFKSHKPNSSESFYIPTCTDTTDNYFIKSGTYADRYDFSRIDSMLTQYEGYGYLEIEFANENVYNEAVNDLFENKNISNAAVFRSGNYSGISYSQDDLSLTIRVIFN